MDAEQALRSETSAWGGASWAKASEAYPTEKPEINEELLRAAAAKNDVERP